MKNTRRKFLKKAALGISATALTGVNLSYANAKPSYHKKLGIALVGLGNYSKNKLAPALLQTQHCELKGIVTGTPSKIPEWKSKYNIPDQNIYNYENYNQIKNNPDIDIVYIVLPNSMHKEYTIRGAEAGKHVICEKPMAVNAQEAEEMIAACDKAGVKLQIGYRLQYEPNTLKIIRLGREKPYGDIKVIETSNAFNAVNMKNWRLQKSLSGGGPLMDMGVYCIQGVRYATGEEPIAVYATSHKTYPDVFVDVEETLFWLMEFESGIIANCMTSYAARAGRLSISAFKGNYGLEPAYGYGPIKGWKRGGTIEFPHTNHQAVQMDAFAKNITEDTPIVASGAEGLQDMKIIDAIYQSMNTGKKVML